MFDKIKNAVKMNKLNNALKNGVVSFTYTKKDGTTRKAVGTLNVDEIVKTGYKTKSEVIAEVSKATDNLYFDVEKKSWRTIYSFVELN